MVKTFPAKSPAFAGVKKSFAQLTKPASTKACTQNVCCFLLSIGNNCKQALTRQRQSKTTNSLMKPSSSQLTKKFKENTELFQKDAHKYIYLAITMGFIPISDYTQLYTLNSQMSVFWTEIFICSCGHI